MSGNGNKFYITTPIYYVNDIPHIGHAYTTIAADILARYNRLMGREVFFLTGTDEHGQKVEKAAAERGLNPKDHADAMVDNFKALWKNLDISNDAFIRTTDNEHKEIVQGLLQRLWDSGEIEKRKYSGMYCTPCERFWTEKDLDQGMCPDCGRPIEEIEEENYFFLMSRYQERLIRHIEENPYFVLPETRRNEVLGFLRTKPLGDLCISRPRHRLAWGIPLPFDDRYTTYVWFDALVNYYSATKYLLPPDKSCAGEWWPATHHLIGKDILTTHSVYWSTMLMALGLPLPRNIFAHGWWTVEGRKMSKSVGNVVEPGETAARFGVDAFRYFLFREVPFGLDGDFSQEAMIGRINTDLANDFGNLCSRVFTMVERYRGGTVPQKGEVELEIKSLAEGLRERVERSLHYLDFHGALDEIWKLVSYINKYIETSAPWHLAKDPSLAGRLDTVLYSSLEAMRLLALYLYPFIPDAAQKLWYQLGYESGLEKEGPKTGWAWGMLAPSAKIRKGEALFPRIEKPSGLLAPAATVQEEEGRPSAQDSEIGIEDFARVELKVGRIVAAERVKKSAKLIRIKVDIGEERQVVAGIGKSYEPDDLIGKYVVIVANLKPAKLMGVESRGMILAASSDESSIALLTFDRDVVPGTRIK